MGRSAGSDTFIKFNSKLPNPFFSQTTISNPKFDKSSITNSRITGNGQHSKSDVRNESFGACRTQPKLCVSVLPYSEKRWNNASNLQFKKFEQIRNSEEIPVNKYAQNFKFHTTYGLVNQNRFDQCLFSFGHSQNTQMLLASNLQTKTLSNDMSALRPRVCAPSFCISNKLGRPNTSRERESYSSIFGRLFTGQSGPKGFTQTSARNNTNLRISRLASQLPQVCPNTTKDYAVSGHPMESTFKSKMSASSEIPRHKQNGSLSFKKKNRQFERNSKSSRDGQFRQLSHPQRALESQSTPQTLSAPIAKEPSGSVSDSSIGLNRIRMVVDQPTQDLTDSLPSSIQLSRYRCLGDSVGCPIKQYSTGRPVDTEGTKTAFQPTRNVSCMVRPPRSRSAPSRLFTFDTERQQNCGCILEERRRDKIVAPHDVDLSDPCRARSIQSSLRNSSPTRSLQRRGRSPVAPNKHSRMASIAQDNVIDIRQVRHTSDRPICVGHCTCCSILRVSRLNRSASLSSRCIQPDLELSSGVGIPAAVLDTTRAETPKHGIRDVFNSCPKMDQSLLEARHKKSSSRPPIYDPRLGPSSSRCDDGQTSSHGVGHDPGGVEMWGWAESLVGWTLDQKQLLQKSWRDSSLKTYRIAWQKWCNWAKENNISFSKPNGSDLARFLIDLHQKHGLAYATILVYKSAVSTLCDPNVDARLSSHLLVRQALKSISIASVKPKKVPIWNTDDLTIWLSNNSPNPDSFYECSARAAILLLLCSGRRVHDLTLLSIDKDNCNWNDNYVIFWPKYGSKTDTVSVRQSGWRILQNKDNKSLDPYFWTKRVVDLSRARRSTCAIDNLFLTTCGDPKAASRTNIAGWIRKVLLQAGIKASPGSVRPAVASKNWVQNCPLDEILTRGNWRSENTFLKYYCREINPPAPTSTSITNLFTPITE